MSEAAEIDPVPAPSRAGATSGDAAREAREHPEIETSQHRPESRTGAGRSSDAAAEAEAEPVLALRPEPVEFRVDLERIRFSSYFARLSAVTQVVPQSGVGPVMHNRLTHSLKVSAVARVIAGRLAGQQARHEAYAAGAAVADDPTGAIDRRVEGRLVARLGVSGAEEVAAGADITHGFNAERVVRQVERGQELGHHLQQVEIEDHLFIGAAQATLQPAGGMQHEIAAALDRAPQGEDGFIGRLRIDRVGGADIGGAVGDLVAAGKLAADHLRLHVFGRAESGRPGFHVDIGGKAAIADRRALFDHLGEGDAGERFGILLHQRPGDGHRRHGAR